MTAPIPDEVRQVLAGALPIDPDDGTVVVGFDRGHGTSIPQWGSPEAVADRLLEALTADGYRVVKVAGRATRIRRLDFVADPNDWRWPAEVDRLRAALKVCEEALCRTGIVGATDNTGDDADLLHDAQQASGAWCTDWQPTTTEKTETT